MDDWQEHYLRSIERDYSAWVDFFLPLSSIVRRREENKPTDLFTMSGELRTVKHESGSGVHEISRDALSAVVVLVSQGIFVLGPPGSGKTMLLQQAMVKLVRCALDDPRRPVPVFVPLRFLGNSVEALVAMSMAEHGGPSTTTAVEALLHDGQALLLVDGLNEAVDPNSARRLLGVFHKRWSKCGVVYSAREHAHWDELAKYELVLNSLTPSDVALFADRYAPDVAARALQRYAGLTTPLLVRLACVVLSQTPDAEGLSEGDIYREFTRRYGQRRDIPSGQADEFYPHCEVALVSLGVHQFKTAESTTPRLALPAAEALEVVASSITGGVEGFRGDLARRLLQYLLDWHLLRRIAGHVEFLHQRFAEYYASHGLLQLQKHLPPDPLKWRYLNHFVWEEPLCLAASSAETLGDIEQLVTISGSLDPVLGDRVMRSLRRPFTPEERRARIRSWASSAWKDCYAAAVEERLMYNAEDGHGHTVEMYCNLSDESGVEAIPHIDVDEDAAHEIESIFAFIPIGHAWYTGKPWNAREVAGRVRQKRKSFLDPPDACKSPRMVFISYASEDHDLVAPYVEACRAAGLEPWFDRHDIEPGDSIPKKVEDGIEQCSAMVVFHSAHYAEKHWGDAEWGAFLGRMLSGETNRRLVVYRLDYEQELSPLLAANLWRANLSPFQLATELADVMGVELTMARPQGGRGKASK